MKCIRCDNKIEQDEGVGNLEDGYTCFECLSEERKLIKTLEKMKRTISEITLEEIKEKEVVGKLAEIHTLISDVFNLKKLKKPYILE